VSACRRRTRRRGFPRPRSTKGSPDLDSATSWRSQARRTGAAADLLHLAGRCRRTRMPRESGRRAGPTRSYRRRSCRPHATSRRG
jgi:hypothetical protein